MNDIDCEAVCKLYFFGMKARHSKLRDAIVSAFLSMFNIEDVADDDWFPAEEIIKKKYDNSDLGLPPRRVVVDIWFLGSNLRTG